MLRTLAPESRLVLHLVGCWRLSPELERYLLGALATRWPQVRGVRGNPSFDRKAPQPDLWLCGAAPRSNDGRPALILGEISRVSSLVQLGERLWHCATPLNAAVLVAHVEALLGERGPPS